jgi:hypothetical protein
VVWQSGNGALASIALIKRCRPPLRHGAHPLEAIELDCVIRDARRRPERCDPDAYRVRHLAMSLKDSFCVQCLVLFLILIARFVTIVL